LASANSNLHVYLKDDWRNEKDTQASAPGVEKMQASEQFNQMAVADSPHDDISRPDLENHRNRAF
jgi:hypothetical protein